MSTLALFGVLNEYRTFEASRFDVAQLAQIYSRDENDQSFMLEIVNLATEHGRVDVARHINAGLRSSGRRNRYLSLRRWLKGTIRDTRDRLSRKTHSRIAQQTVG